METILKELLLILLAWYRREAATLLNKWVMQPVFKFLKKRLIKSEKDMAFYVHRLHHATNKYGDN